MKKVIVSGLVGILLASSLQAKVVDNEQEKQRGLSSFGMGGGTTKFNNQKEEFNIYMHLDIIPRKSTSNFGYGAGIDYMSLGDVVNYNARYSDRNKAQRNYVLGLQLKAGYTLNSLIGYPVDLKAGVGYGVTRLIDTNFFGMQYEVSVDVKIYSSYQYLSQKSRI